MPTWIQHVLESPTPGLAVLPAALLLGVLGSVSSCGNLAVVGAIAGYSGSLSESPDRRGVMLSGLFFMLGTILALSTLGVVVGSAGKLAGASLGSYWKLIAGLIIVMFGLASFDLLPFRLPSFDLGSRLSGQGTGRSMLYGLALGGGATGCSLSCNPVLLVALGFATLHGVSAWGATVFVTFALGYSLPLALGLVGLGLGLGKLTTVAQKLAPVVRVGGGGVLVAVGFYLLATI